MSISTDDLLSQALNSLSISGADLKAYTFTKVAGATQATVWKGTSRRDQEPAVALRLTPRPLELMQRIGALLDDVREVECPLTLHLAQMTADGRELTVHVCTWIGLGAPLKADMRVLGRHLARLHGCMAASSLDFTDRRLSFEHSPAPPPDLPLPAWYVARDLWRDRIYAWQSTPLSQVAAQPIHGDLQWGNIVATRDGFGFIDFDKVMFGPPVFDLAKLIATGMFRTTDMFRTGGRVRFQARKTMELLEGYESIRMLSDTELLALEALTVLINGETARLGEVFDVQAYRTNADAVASWWITRRYRSASDPLGIRATRKPTSRTAEPETTQDALWADEHTDPTSPAQSS